MLNRHSIIACLLLSAFLARGASAAPGDGVGRVQDWRYPSSHSLAEHRVATSALREKLLVERRDYMHGILFDAFDSESGQSIGRVDTPRMEFIAEDGVTAEKKTLAWTSHEIPELRISGLGPSGRLRGTLILPVSGHRGVWFARRWSTTDLYRVSFTDASGRRTELIPGARSLDAVTFHDVELPLAPGANLLHYSRGQNLGVSGYPDGRTIVLQWDGT